MTPESIDPAALGTDASDVSPWSIRAEGFDESLLGRRESVFTLSNGHVGWRGNLDEGEPSAEPGSFLNGVHELHPMPYAEPGYGYPARGQAVVNVTDGKVIRLFVDDDPFDMRRGRLHHHEQRLDMRDGVLRRRSRWTSPSGSTVTVESERLVSLTHRAVAAIRYTVTADEHPVAIAVQSELVANEPLPSVHPDPRVQDALDPAFAAAGQHTRGDSATLVHRTRESGIHVAVCMDHETSGDATVLELRTDVSDDLARTTIRSQLPPGARLTIVKYVGHEEASGVSVPGLRDRAEEAVNDARRTGWDGLAAQQRATLDGFWHRADVVVDGDDGLQQAIRFALYQVFQSAARLEGRSVPSKGLTGTGYAGHTFWDSEAFVLPAFTYLEPAAVRTALQWRHDTLPQARERARELHLEGAAFPWRTIDGRESSGYWPAGTAAFHNNAAIAAAVCRYVRATGDVDFERDAGAEILIETSRLWASLGRWDADGGFHIDGVTGPDEYSALADDNVYTNLSARENLAAGVAVARRHPDVARRLGVTEAEIEVWSAAAEAMAIGYDAELGVHPQSAGFTRHARWDFDATRPDQYPLQEHFPYVDLYRKQVVKQADLVLALYTSCDAFTLEEKARDFAYYESLTVRDSSLSACVQSIIAAEVGHLDLALDYLDEASGIDLADTQGDTADGLHIASLAGTWSAIVAGLGGMRETDRGLRFAPRLPAPLRRVCFRLTLRKALLEVDVAANRSRYTLIEGERCAFRHFDEEIVLVAGESVTRSTPAPRVLGPKPQQPPSREPKPR
ncbi:glycoside hydrolase family 65 protein [Microbacterium paludicola]|uniref:glycoside hydrolase family 65 protein n=1 Tax=Microbacterium paludicola TaxID=300019 RepID=UPI0031E146D6